MKVFVTVIVVGVLIVILDLLIGIADAFTAPESPPRDTVQAQSALPGVRDLVRGPGPPGHEVPWNADVKRYRAPAGAHDQGLLRACSGGRPCNR